MIEVLLSLPFDGMYMTPALVLAIIPQLAYYRQSAVRSFGPLLVGLLWLGLGVLWAELPPVYAESMGLSLAAEDRNGLPFGGLMITCLGWVTVAVRLQFERMPAEETGQGQP